MLAVIQQCFIMLHFPGCSIVDSVLSPLSALIGIFDLGNCSLKCLVGECSNLFLPHPSRCTVSSATPSSTWPRRKWWASWTALMRASSHGSPFSSLTSSLASQPATLSHLLPRLLFINKLFSIWAVAHFSSLSVLPPLPNQANTFTISLVPTWVPNSLLLVARYSSDFSTTHMNKKAQTSCQSFPIGIIRRENLKRSFSSMHGRASGPAAWMLSRAQCRRGGS